MKTVTTCLAALSFLVFVNALPNEGHGESIHTAKFFKVAIAPSFFNWTEVADEYKYHASLLRAPDLPDWIQYLYSRRHQSGFLYGVPPANFGKLEIVTLPCKRPCTARTIKQWRTQVEVIGMNRKTYETRRRVLQLTIHETPNPATHHIHLKIDNLDVEDLFDKHRLSKLLDIFKYRLWMESFPDLHVTFMTSAVTQGARLPLHPGQSVGVVMKLGSTSPFSQKLLDLQDEVKPLWKLHPCPAGYKRTTVERWFRDENFQLDWCSFKLITEASNDLSESDSPPSESSDSLWYGVSRSELPNRSYAAEFGVTVLVPMFLMVLLVIMLSVVLCFQHEGISKRKEGETDEEITQYVAVQRATSTLRSLSRPREETPDYSLTTTVNADDITRPTPPPYSGTLRSNKEDF